jgi:tRNA threonylcarbamoyladenosine biosynthesis protein TsaE
MKRVIFSETHTSLKHTKALARKFAKILLKLPSALILLSADMGAGKTTFTGMTVRAIDKSIRPHSPTFTIINAYADNIFHADLYRISDERELENTDLFDAVNGDNYVFIEWHENSSNLHARNIFEVEIVIIDETTRKFTIYEVGK